MNTAAGPNAATIESGNPQAGNVSVEGAPLLAMESIPPRRSASNSHSWLGKLIVLILTAIGVWLVAKVLYLNQKTLASIIAGETAWEPLAVALFCLLGNQLICICRWIVLIRALGVNLTVFSSIGFAVAAEAAGLAIPGSNGGDVVKLGTLMRSHNASMIVASIIADRMTGLLGMLCVGSLAGGLMWTTGLPQERQITLLTFAVLTVALVTSMIALGPSRTFALRLIPRRWRWLNHLVAKIDESATIFQAHPQVLYSATMISIVGQTLTLTAIYQISMALYPNDHASWGTTLLAGPWVLISTALPLPFGALGVTEMFSDELFRALGHAGAGITALFFRLLQIFSTSILVFSWLTIRRINNLSG